MSHTGRIAAALLGLLAAVSGEAKVNERTLPYAAGDTTCQGFLAYDDAVAGPRPGVMVVHDWLGLGEFARARCRELAAMGYVALAADMYGDGKLATDPAGGSALAGALYANPALMRGRAAAALAALKAQPGVDPKRVAAIGYCFGGSTVLQLAYSGADLAGVVSFHGGLKPPEGDDLGRIKAKILILHGAADPHVKPDAVQATLDGLTAAHADWQFVAYANAVHAFTNPAAGNDPSRGAAYNANAARRSWIAMQSFFAELFNPPAA
jgi:dienelactone hydrolase